MSEHSNGRVADVIDRFITAAASGNLSAEDSNGQRPEEIDPSAPRTVRSVILSSACTVSSPDSKTSATPKSFPVRRVFACGEFNRLRNLMRSEIMPSGLRADGNAWSGI